MTVGQAAQGGTGKAMLAYSDNLVMTTTSALDGCDIYVNEGSLQVAPGRIWAKFSCPQISAQPEHYCKANGVFVLENREE